MRSTTVLDGDGEPARPADILIADGRIVAVEPYGSIGADRSRVMDCGTDAVTPGFIDVHAHSDSSPLLEEPDTAKLGQGVTTEVVGNCGFSLAPYTGEHRADLQDCLDRLFPSGVPTFAAVTDLIDAMNRAGSVTTMVTLVGHHALRAAVLGSTAVTADAGAVSQMAALAGRCLTEGAVGISSGLIYTPGSFADTDELASIAAMLPPDRLYTTHLRSEGSGLIASVHEALDIARRSGCRLHISHLKSMGRNGWGVVPRVLDELDHARTQGIEVTTDMYPYPAASTMLASLLPPWALAGGREQTLRRLVDPRVVDRLRRDLAVDGESWENLAPRVGWDGLVVASTQDHHGEGRSLAELAGESAGDPVAVLVDLLVRNDLEATMIMHAMHENDVRAVMAWPWAMVGSDGLPRGTGGRPHPRTFGTFPRVLARYVREEQLMPLAEAVRSMTSLPADVFGLSDRGRIRAGMVADLVCFDAEEVSDRATFAEPEQPPVGIRWVMQSGEVTMREGVWSGKRLGRWLAA